MASLPKPPKTSKELKNAVHDEWKRQVIDDAKHRAVKQHEDYETFKNMVSVAHLKPLEGGLRDLQKKPVQGEASVPAWSFNSQGKMETHKDAGSVTIGGTASVPDKPPENAIEFEKAWRRNCRTASDRYQYLCMIPEEKIAAMFKVEITGTMLGDVMLALSEAFAAEEEKALKAQKLLSLLDILTKSGRFSLTARLLSGKPKKAAEALFLELGNAGVDVTSVKSAYGIK